MSYTKTGKDWNGNVRMTDADFNNFESGIVINETLITEFPNLPQDESRIPNIVNHKKAISDALQSTRKFSDEQFSLELPWSDYRQFPQNTAFYAAGKLKESAHVYNEVVSVYQPYIDRLDNIIYAIKNKANELLMSISKNKYLGQTQTATYTAPRSDIFPSWVNRGSLTVTRTDTRVDAFYSMVGNMPVKFGENEVILATIPPVYAGHDDVGGKITASSGVLGGSLRFNTLHSSGQLRIRPLLPDKYKSMSIEVRTTSKRCTPLISLKPIDVYGLIKV